ncbi:MAG: hypothetical protein V2G47_06875, partial [bacterium JZ-2024 1]
MKLMPRASGKDFPQKRQGKIIPLPPSCAENLSPSGFFFEKHPHIQSLLWKATPLPAYYGEINLSPSFLCAKTISPPVSYLEVTLSSAFLWGKHLHFPPHEESTPSFWFSSGEEKEDKEKNKIYSEIIMESIQRFQDLLKKLFQFESSDLDFGIYRILNYKRDRIEKFIEKDLKDKVEAAFARHKDERLTNINEKFEKVKEKVIQSLGENAFTPAGDLKEEFRSTPIGKEFLSIKAQKEEVEKIDEIKNQVFNDLYNFFFRFYEEGDFVPQYRYSIKGHKYAIPYNGEEVKLYWANQEQYYTKTGLLFRDYTFKTGDY